MPEEQLKAFLDKAKGDISLQEKLKAAGDTKEAVAAMTSRKTEHLCRQPKPNRITSFRDIKSGAIEHG